MELVARAPDLSYRFPDLSLFAASARRDSAGTQDRLIAAAREDNMPMKPEDVLSGSARPFTGKDYLASLRDGREVYIYGERVDDVTTHPAFRNAARSIARLYDALYDSKSKDMLTCPTDTGSGGFPHKLFKVARSREDVIGQRVAIAEWARLPYGWPGRTA